MRTLTCSPKVASEIFEEAKVGLEYEGATCALIINILSLLIIIRNYKK